MRCAAGLVMGVLALGIGTSGAWAERVEAIAILRALPSGTSDEKPTPSLTLLAVFRNGAWISGETLQEHDPQDETKPKHQEVYNLLKGRAFVPADGSAGRFVAETPIRIEILDAQALSCRGSHPVGRRESTVVVTKRHRTSRRVSASSPDGAVFLAVAGQAIDAQEQEHLNYLRRHYADVSFEPSSKEPLLVKEAKPVPLFHGAVSYWVTAEKAYEEYRTFKAARPSPARFLYYGLFFRGVDDQWRAAWECTMFSGQGESKRLMGSPLAVCDIDRDSRPEIVLPETAFDLWGWRMLEQQGERFCEVGSLFLGI